ncbi:MAG: hypothetical protein JSR09_00510 [Bacteroidetes bacterium]|nr:hypothetical protein [Bacteroidota bacterium]MBS1648165.1 hypothetical protein [Bacteroidota bacterium]
MKKILLMMIFSSSCLLSSAQGHIIARGGRGYYRPRTTVIVGGGFYYPYSYYPFGYYPYYNMPYMLSARPSKLDQKIADIEHEYAQRIESARMDLKGKEKRHEIRQLKEARDHEIDMAKRNYYKS